MSHPHLDLQVLQRAVAGEAVALRAVTKLHPAGGPGDKVFPPTYTKEGKAETKYAIEVRRIEGKEVTTVLLDSVASQANRMEEALLEGWRDGELEIPLVQVDFTEEEGLEDLETISALEAPHRIADAILRDSVSADGVSFRFTEAGREFTDARLTHATGLYKHCPTALVFGIWDSTGPKGGLGAKFQRCLVSEIVGYGVAVGRKVASRIDPLGIERGARIYESDETPGDWTMDPEAAVKEKGKPKEFGRTDKAAEKGTPAGINHGNIPPSVDSEAGGVTMDYAVHSVVLSFAGLRRLRFQTAVDGSRLDSSRRKEAETAARVALAALGLAAIVYQAENGYDLRSRSLLVPAEPLVLELVRGGGREPDRFEIDRPRAAALLSDARQAAAEHGMAWPIEPLTLKPAPKLAELVRRSRDLSAQEEGQA
jgi:CRISPR-associated protein Csb1